MTKKLLLALCLVIAAFSQCRTNKTKQLNESRLPSQYFTIDINRDTILHTAKGALINIPKGSVKSDAANVKLEIKEAYTIADMVLGGLTTRAGKDLLSSGGMIFINPADNSNATIVQPISVSIPTPHITDGMQLYKGEKTADGTIDWTMPQPLPKPELTAPVARGKALYTDNCASCHNPTKEATGPGLAFLDQRRDWKWLTRFIRNSSKMIADGDQLANCVFEHYNKTQMTAFPTLTDDDIRNIFDYVNYEVGSTAASSIPDFKKSFDSCVQYHKLAGQLAMQRDSLVLDNGVQVTTERQPVTPVQTTGAASTNGGNTGVTLMTLPDNMVEAAYNKAVYYQVKIQAWGWYNVDILLKNLPGFENSTLMVRAIGEYREEINIYLVIPDYKILLPGGPVANKKEEYAFFTDDGQIPLPQGTKAFILAMGETNGKLYFGKTDFVTGQKQAPEIQVIATTVDQVDVEIKKLDIADLNVSAGNSRNAEQLRKIDAKLSALEKFKPKNCDCNCLVKPEPADTAIMERIMR